LILKDKPQNLNLHGRMAFPISYLLVSTPEHRHWICLVLGGIFRPAKWGGKKHQAYDPLNRSEPA